MILNDKQSIESDINSKAISYIIRYDLNNKDFNDGTTKHFVSLLRAYLHELKILDTIIKSSVEIHGVDIIIKIFLKDDDFTLNLNLSRILRLKKIENINKKYRQPLDNNIFLTYICKSNL